jgi:hypothetical protein
MTSLRRVDTIITGVTGGGIQQFYFTEAGGTAAACTQAVRDFWDACKAQISSGITFAVQSSVPRVEDTNGNIVAIDSGTAYSVTGTGGTALAPLATQGLLRLRTGVYEDGREIRGRVFIPGVPTNAVASGAPHPDYLTVLNTAGAALVSAILHELVVYRRERQAADALGTPGVPGYRPAHDHRDGTHALVTTTSAWTKFATLRSRRD